MSKVLVVIDYRQGEQATIYLEPSKQIQVIKQLFLDVIKLKQTSKELSPLHAKLEYEIADNEISSSESDHDSSDDECRHCGHSNKGCKAETTEQWSYEDRILRCKDLIEEFESLQLTRTTLDWFNLAKDCELDFELNNHIKYHLAQIDNSRAI